MRPVFRFAPSPNGRLHLGHALSALLNDAFARETGGRLLLRIEDIDTTRSREEFVDAIRNDLAWLGLHWEEPVRRQSEQLAFYRDHAADLRRRGLLYPCFCSRARLAEAAPGIPASGRDPDGVALYPGVCRVLADSEILDRLAKGDAHCWRLDMNAALQQVAVPILFRRFDRQGAEDWVAANPARWGDVVIVRRDTPTSYHLSVVADDAVQGVTHVVRGADLEAATDIHVLLQRLLGLAAPRYHHHRLVTDAAGLKLAKSRGSPALADLRLRGVGATAIRSALGL